MRKAHWPIVHRREMDQVRDMQDWVRLHGALAIQTHDEHHPPAHPGISDLVLCWPARITVAMVGRVLGLFGVVEGKSEEAMKYDRAKDELQRVFMADVAEHSGIVIKARDYTDIETALKIRGLL